MPTTEVQSEITADQIRRHQIEDYWAGDLSRRMYLLRRQRKAILETCRRIAVIGAGDHPANPSFVSVEKLLGLCLEVIPVFSDRASFLGLRCYRNLREVPGKIDIVQVYPTRTLDFVELARAAVDRGVSAFWVEQGAVPSREVEEILAGGRVQLVEYESFEREHLKHMPFAPTAVSSRRRDKNAAKVKDRMSKNAATAKPNDGLKDAIWKMEHGRFRHLPVVDDNGKLIGMLSDRDIRLVRPSLAFVNREEANVQLWSISVQQAAVFEPIKVTPETTLKEAAELMLRWQVGGLPVVGEKDKLVGVITYTDLLREFVGHEP